MTLYVWDMESAQPELVGVYVRTDEDAVCYTYDGVEHWAPADCVTVNEGQWPLGADEQVAR